MNELGFKLENIRYSWYKGNPWQLSFSPILREVYVIHNNNIHSLQDIPIITLRKILYE